MAQGALLKAHQAPVVQNGTKCTAQVPSDTRGHKSTTCSCQGPSVNGLLNALHGQEIHSIKALRLSGILLYQQQFSILNYAYVGLYLPLLDGNHGDIDPT